MKDLKLISKNNTQRMLSQARFNSHINTVGNSNPVELLLYIQELNSVIELNELDHLEEARIKRALEFENVAKLEAKIEYLTEIIHKKETK